VGEQVKIQFKIQSKNIMDILAKKKKSRFLQYCRSCVSKCYVLLLYFCKFLISLFGVVGQQKPHIRCLCQRGNFLPVSHLICLSMNKIIRKVFSKFCETL